MIMEQRVGIVAGALTCVVAEVEAGTVTLGCRSRMLLIGKTRRNFDPQAYRSLVSFFTYGRSQGSCQPKEQGDY
jgi:hypothetical protein